MCDLEINKRLRLLISIILCEQFLKVGLILILNVSKFVTFTAFWLTENYWRASIYRTYRLQVVYIDELANPRRWRMPAIAAFPSRMDSQNSVKSRSRRVTTDVPESIILSISCAHSSVSFSTSPSSSIYLVTLASQRTQAAETLLIY